MKAVVCTRWGSRTVLRVEEVARPIPKVDEVLIKVHAATVTTGDCELRAMNLSLPWQIAGRIGFGFRGPRQRILGQEIAGEVESVGDGVRKFAKGERVFAFTGFRLGAYAEYACMKEGGLLAEVPPVMSYDEAAALPAGGLHALNSLKKADIRSGQKVLIVGAGGTVGTIAVQLAKSSGAQVTAVDSGSKLDMLRSIGADEVIDYTKGEVAESVGTYDVVFDAIGKNSLSLYLGTLKEGGVFVLGNPTLSQLVRRGWVSRRSNRRVVGGTVSYSTEDLVKLGQLAEAGKISPVIDRRFPLERTADAHRYVETGQKAGNVVITVGEPSGN